MRVTEMLRMNCSQIWSRMIRHPFVLELYEGTLPAEKFRYYVLQDYSYLSGLMRCMCVIASKSDAELMREVLHMTHDEATSELESYKRTIASVGLSMDEALKTEPAPTNLAYMNFILTTAYTKSPVEGLTAILPCFWGYADIAETNKALLEDNRNEVYKAWASVYLERSTKDLVEELRCIVDSLDDHESASRIFMTASRYECMFWDMAYKQERWIV
jgi:thiaminase/transcriptional activator TenA